MIRTTIFTTLLIFGRMLDLQNLGTFATPTSDPELKFAGDANLRVGESQHLSLKN